MRRLDLTNIPDNRRGTSRLLAAAGWGVVWALHPVVGSLFFGVHIFVISVFGMTAAVYASLGFVTVRNAQNGLPRHLTMFLFLETIFLGLALMMAAVSPIVVVFALLFVVPIILTTSVMMSGNE
jgi:hypothetical protein